MSSPHPNLHTLQPLVRIGKSGINTSILNEISKHLKKRKIIKVKFLKSSLEGNDVDNLAQHIAKHCNAQIVQRTGFVVTYAIQKLPPRH